jgi:glycosyltransferase involved in cell wall biosynthesis
MGGRVRLKIVYVLESLQQGGGVKVIVEQARGLAARGHLVEIVTKDARHDWIAIDVPISEVPAFSRETLPESDVMVATWFPTVVPVVEARRAPRIFHLCQGYEGLHEHVAHRRAEIDAAYAQDVPKLVVSEHLRAVLDGVPGRVQVIPQAIDPGAFAPPDDGRDAPRVPATLGLVGPFAARLKGIAHGLDAVRLLRAEGRVVRLLRACQLPETPEERELLAADEYAHAIPAGGMPRWYHRLDVLLFTSSHEEGFGLPALEAMAAGVPAVVTDIPSLRILPDDALMRVPERDSRAIARAAGRLLDDAALWRARRARGLEVAATFTLDRTLDRLEEIFGARDQKTS